MSELHDTIIKSHIVARIVCDEPAHAEKCKGCDYVTRVVNDIIEVAKKRELSLVKGLEIALTEWGDKYKSSCDHAITMAERTETIGKIIRLFDIELDKLK